MNSEASFARLVGEAMASRALGLRELCRRADLDPSFLSKVLAGKRNPPWEEEPLRRLADALGLDPVELIVAAGRIPSEWGAVRSDGALFRAVHAVATGRRPAAPRRDHAPVAPSHAPSPRGAVPVVAPKGLSEELL